MEEVKIQGGKVLNACREVQIQVRINIYQDGDHDVNVVLGILMFMMMLC